MKTLRLNTVTPRYFQLFSCKAGLRAYDEFFAPSQVMAFIKKFKLSGVLQRLISLTVAGAA